MARSGSGSPRRRRLSRSGDFKRAYREGSSKASRYLVLYRFKRGDEDSPAARLGVSVSKKLGDAVTRNRIKRLLKEAFWAKVSQENSVEDFVLVARPALGPLIEEQGLTGAAGCVEEVLGEKPPPDGAGRST
ncbi:MAG: ribonuclease P protein component [Solirubrobacterales bacterium]